MQSDFHYCAIRTLAQMAGFCPEEAQIIAYASQYTDDATEHKWLKIKKVPSFAHHLCDDDKKRFNPVCTAHKGIQFLSSRKKDVQRKVYIPFHFIPGSAYSGAGMYDYRVVPNGPFAIDLLQKKLKKYKPGKKNNLRSLIGIGIALHTFADTWSHMGFSGRHSASDNDIERIKILDETGKLKSINFMIQAGLNIVWDIGHGEAGNYPDQSHLVWQYEHDQTGLEHPRNNTSDFMVAANTIYRNLCSITGNANSWKGFSRKIRHCLSYETDSVSKKFERWKDTFSSVDFKYNPQQWRSEALGKDEDEYRIDWDHFDNQSDYDTLSYVYNGDPKWFYFHVEAAAQRQYVRKGIRDDLL